MENYNLIEESWPHAEYFLYIFMKKLFSKSPINLKYFSELYSLLILITAHWKRSIILRRSTSSYFWKHLVILVEAHGSITSVCSTSMSKCVHKYEMVLLKVWRGASLSMMNCFQCAVTSMSKEYKFNNLTTLKASIFSYNLLFNVKMCQKCSIRGLVPFTKL